jgi:hypothetical protein
MPNPSSGGLPMQCFQVRNVTIRRMIVGLVIANALSSCTSSVTVEVVPSNKNGACASSANATISSKYLCSPATNLGWAEASPQSITAATTIVTATWTRSTSSLLANQKIQFYTGQACDTPTGDLIDLKSNATQSHAFTGTAGSYTFIVTSFDARENRVSSACSAAIDIRTTNTAAQLTTSYVIGQTSTGENQQGVMGLSYNSDTFVVNGKLFIADPGNHRVLIWNSIPTTFGQAPNLVIGQPDLSNFNSNLGNVSGSSFNGPFSVYSDGVRLFVCDSYNSRVLIWNTIPTVSNQPADIVLGQPDMTSRIANNGGISGSSMRNPTAVRGNGTKLFVVDGGNHRVLVWNSMPSSSGQSANFAIGQPNLTSNTSNNGGISGSTLAGPLGIGFAGSKLFIGDSNNNRVLAWNSIPSTSGQAADFVLGQPDMTSNTQNNGGVSGTTLSSAVNIATDGTRLFVVDKNNSRILVWTSVPTMTAQSADFALGQPDLTSNTQNNGGVSGSSLNQPYGLFTDGTRLFVNDYFNSRVLVWNTIPTISGQSASFAIGQSVLTSATIRTYYKSSSALLRPAQVYSNGSKLVVTDTFGHRVLIYNTVPTSSGQSADIVIGQPDFASTTANNGGLGASSLHTPMSAIIAGTKLFVSDWYNNRVLIWNTLPTTNGQPADLVLGQTDFTTNSSNSGGVSGASLAGPTGIFSDDTKLYIADSLNNRVLVWNNFPTTTAQSANYTLGQVDLTSQGSGVSSTTMSYPSALHSNGTNLFVADSNNNRILFWNIIPTTSGQPADFALGQPDLSSGAPNNGGLSSSSMSFPAGVSAIGPKLYVSDTTNNRILIWNTIPTTSGQPADAVFGQNNFTSGLANAGAALSASVLNSPQRIFGAGDRLFIPDYINSRVLVITAP